MYIALCLVGVGAILASSIAIMIALKLAGGAFLTYLAVMALKARKRDYAYLDAATASAAAVEASFFAEFATGFASGMLNPKNPLFYLSLFTLVLTNEVGLAFKIALGVWMTLAVFAWDAFIIFILSRRRVRSVFNRMAYYIDKLTGAILGILGVKIMHSALFEEGI